MANQTTVTLASGVPNAPSGTVSSLDGAAGWLNGQANTGAGLTWRNLFETTDFSTSHAGGNMQTGDYVLSTSTVIANGTDLDRYMDISLRVSIASSTIAAGANFSFWIYDLLDDGTTYGDGQHTAGTADTKAPGFSPVATIGFYAAASQTTLTGSARGIIIPPGSFKMLMLNNCGFTITGGNICKYRTYR